MKMRFGIANISMKVIASFYLFFLTCIAHAALPASVIDALKQSNIPQTSVGVYVQAVDATPLIITHNAQKGLNPASVMKLITTNAALDLLTPAYRWKTEIYRDGEVVNGVLNGNLIIKGFGDPNFKAQDFWRLLMRVQQAGIREIKGDLIIDKSLFAKNGENLPAFDDEIWRAYNAKSSAFLVDGRHSSFRFSTTNTAVNVNQEFALNEVEVINNIQLSQAACGDWRSRLLYTVKSKSHGNNNAAVVTFNGTFSPDCGERYLELSVLDDEQYAFYTFKKLWRELGGVFNGQLSVKLTTQNPSKLQNSSWQDLDQQDLSRQDLAKKPNLTSSSNSIAVKVLEQVSEPLGYVIRDLNKWSDNLMARQLLLTIAAEKQILPATEAKGAAVIQSWLASKNIVAKELVIENGSGLSRVGRISSEHLGQMLVSAYNSPIMPELIASLPILGLDGTAQKRLKDSVVQGKVHLKTGSLDGVSAVAGYVLSSKNKRYVFVFIVNHANAAASKTAQDALIEWIYTY
ncbi:MULTISPECIES: D-alanyl-D-alanine carboxypeptidase/D-alanyl-D-alanine-endopeptidase [Methylotenera]|uniref:D-alanyl-D-alanine carboxypeptidase/D-alanyl-D-alanine-endopeptidase n=1 Tax=Methylotenera TaxID=359407 RepID=UPI00035CFBB9|nr:MULTISPECIES: D-alanyl-D-alanine carboxypeptidase/D-alanyl-D-alanine-endopeptidase [Methylotenera]